MGAITPLCKSQQCPLFLKDETTDRGVGGVYPIPFGLQIQNDVDYTFTLPFPISIIGIVSVETVAITANSVITLDVGGVNAATTHTVTATGVGTRLRTAVDPKATGNTHLQNIQAGTTITVECDGTASAGEAEIYIEWRHA